jgi:hypothetical protein
MYRVFQNVVVNLHHTFAKITLKKNPVSTLKANPIYHRSLQSKLPPKSFQYFYRTKMQEVWPGPGDSGASIEVV